MSHLRWVLAVLATVSPWGRVFGVAWTASGLRRGLAVPSTVQPWRRGLAVLSIVSPWRRVLAALLVGSACAAATAGVPPDYAPLVVEPTQVADRSEFDLGPALARAKREGKRLYVYLGASDCPYCRRYERFLGQNASALVAPFKPWLVVDLRSTLATTANRLVIRVGDRALDYTEFQRSIGDQRVRMLVYPSVWVLDSDMKPLMQMPAGTGTFETVDEQLEILNLVQ